MIVEANPFPSLLRYSDHLTDPNIKIRLALLLCALSESSIRVANDLVVCKFLEILCQAYLLAKNEEEIK